MRRLDDLSSDVLLGVLSNLNVVDLSRVARSCRRLCYLVDVFQSRVVAPGCDVSSDHALFLSMGGDGVDVERSRGGGGRGRRGRRSAPPGRMRSKVGRFVGDVDGCTPPEVMKRALSGLRSPPTLALTFCASGGGLGDFASAASARAAVERWTPPGCAVLGAVASDVQANCDAEGGFAVMLAALDRRRTAFVPFRLDRPGDDDRLVARLRSSTPAGADFASYWKVIFVYVAGHIGDPDFFISNLQGLFPEASIVGGICDGGSVRLDLGPTSRRRPNEVSSGGGDRARLRPSTLKRRKVKDDPPSQLTEVEQGIFGLVLGGEVPIYSVVSRGVRSLTTDDRRAKTTGWVVSDATIEIPDEIISDDEPFHRIKSVRNVATGETRTAFSWAMRHQPEFFGVRRRGGGTGGDEEDSFAVLPVNADGVALIFPATDGPDEANHVGSEIGLFNLDGPACLEDVGATLDRLRELVDERGERVMGAVMFICSGRGPRAGSLIQEDAADAARFLERFPAVPCVGFYAAGEIGPNAMARWPRDVLRRGQAKLQGFTAVFALFIVPDNRVDKQAIDDSPESVTRHMQQKLGMMEESANL